MAKVTILVLEGCTRCGALKNKLAILNNSFKYIPCDGDSEFCDEVETLSGVDRYPIVVVTDIKDKISSILYITEDYNKIGIKENIVDGIVKIGVHSIDQLAEYIIKL